MPFYQVSIKLLLLRTNMMIILTALMKTLTEICYVASPLWLRCTGGVFPLFFWLSCVVDDCHVEHAWRECSAGRWYCYTRSVRVYWEYGRKHKHVSRTSRIHPELHLAHDFRGNLLSNKHTQRHNATPLLTWHNGVQIYASKYSYSALTMTLRHARTSSSHQNNN